MVKGSCCVLIPYFNSPYELISSVSSIVEDGYVPDIVIVDDGSEIRAQDYIPQLKGCGIVHLIELPENQGIEHALNAGLSYACDKYEFIARLDCGDKVINSRLRKQLNFLQANPCVYMVGGGAEFVALDGSHIFTYKAPVGYKNIKRAMLLNSAFAHVSVMYRSSVFDKVGFYPTDIPAAEDYGLFFNIIKFYEVQNLSDIIVSCTVDPEGISSKKRSRQIRSRLKVMAQNFNYTPLAFYGVIRSLFLLFMPRKFSLRLNQLKSKIISQAR